MDSTLSQLKFQQAFCRDRQGDSKIIGNAEETTLKKNRRRGLALLDFTIYYQTIVVESAELI